MRCLNTGSQTKRYFNTFSAPAEAPGSRPFSLIPISLGLFFELVLPESTGEGSRPHVQGCPGREGEEEEVGNLETKPIHQTSSQSAECQLPQHLQSGQEAVVGRLIDGVEWGGRTRGKEGRNDEERVRGGGEGEGSEPKKSTKGKEEGEGSGEKRDIVSKNK